jgi:hypothetical protein
MKILVVAATVLALAGPAAARGAPDASTPPAGSAAAAPSAEKLALARELITENGGLAAFQALIEKMTSPDKDEGAETTQAMAKPRAEMRRKMLSLVPEVVEAFARVYADTYSADQLRDMIAYVKSPVGRAVQARRPKMTEAMTPESAWAMAAIAATDDASAPAPPPLPTPRPSDVSLALAARLVALSHAAEVVADSPFRFNRMLGAVVAAAAPGDLFKPEPDDTASLRRMKSRAMALLPRFAERLAWIVASVYTDEELRGQIAYLQSPTGQLALKLKPQVEAQMQAAVIEIVKRKMAETQPAG